MPRPGVPLVLAFALSGVLHTAAAIWVPDFAGRARARPPSVLTVSIAAVAPRAAMEATVPPAPEVEPRQIRDRRAALERAPRSRVATAGAPSAPAPIARVQAPPRADPAPAAPLPARADDGGGDTGDPMAEATRTAALQSQTAARAAPEAGSAAALSRSGVDYLDNPQPEYPAAARRLRMEGTVVLRVLVSSDGLPSESRVARARVRRSWTRPRCAR